MTRPPGRDRRRGVVLLLVLVFTLVLTASVATFLRRAMVDTVVIRHRDDAARAEALARGGVRLAIALLIQDRVEEQANDRRDDNLEDPWAAIRDLDLPAGPSARLRLTIEDSGARLNLNALVDPKRSDALTDEAEAFLVELFEKVNDEVDPASGGGPRDPRELARNLVDWLDEDSERIRGGDENEYYRRQNPPYVAANRPLLSVEELQLIEGFDGAFVRALAPYVTVYPVAEGGGINLNTAPSWVLAVVYHGAGFSKQLASEDTVRRILRERQEGRILCQSDAEDSRCVPQANLVEGDLFPESKTPYSTDVFSIRAEAQVGDIRRRIEAVVDRSQPAEPRLLSWRLR
ncbi:MAG: type II secretion system minor pseudopilin GspK [Proteobacteria bacterium]|nr:type II secretion system minor pseudopilin GspK [Pseudomonadota bacterium]